ncbi:MAG: helix-turn-helix domain-containing protein [Paracoccaceae bacterium]|nr:helix-turn-helix domain-containing protein [Paracoccaceae bacterium]
MRELADAMSPKVTAQAISKYEAGKMLPSSAVLIGLGKALDVSLDFLMSAQVEALDAVEFRMHSRAGAAKSSLRPLSCPAGSVWSASASRWPTNSRTGSSAPPGIR